MTRWQPPSQPPEKALGQDARSGSKAGLTRKLKAKSRVDAREEARTGVARLRQGGAGLQGRLVFSRRWYSRDSQARRLGGFGDRGEAGGARARWSIHSTGSGVALQEMLGAWAGRPQTARRMEMKIQFLEGGRRNHRESYSKGA